MSNPSEDHHLERPAAHAEAPTSIAEIEVVPGRRCEAADADEPLGGDPPCWAHLFEDDLTSEDR